MPLTATVARLWNEVAAKLFVVLFPFVSNVLISLMLAEAKEVTFVASIFPVVLLFKVVKAGTEKTIV